MPCGYSGLHAAPVLDAYLLKHKALPSAIFVNSTITLEGTARWFHQQGHNMSEIVFGCFDWDPLAAVFNPHFLMVRQNVPIMVERLFELMERPRSAGEVIEIQPEILGDAA